MSSLKIVISALLVAVAAGFRQPILRHTLQAQVL
jgi:hypothetical protein